MIKAIVRWRLVGFIERQQKRQAQRNARQKRYNAEVSTNHLREERRRLRQHQVASYLRRQVYAEFNP